MLVCVNTEDLATVILLASETLSRSDAEQRSLLKVAARCDQTRNKDTVTNTPVSPPSVLEAVVHVTRGLDGGDGYIKPSWEKKRRRAVA